MSSYYDIIVIGAGPAGCACAYQLATSGLSVALLDKEKFPRDKICGDAISADAVNQLFRMDVQLGEQFLQLEQKMASKGVRFIAPNYNCLDVHYVDPRHAQAAGYIVKRTDFDSFLLKKVMERGNIHFLPEQKVIDIFYNDDTIEAVTPQTKLKARLIVGADGANSVVKRKLIGGKIEKAHHYAGLRQYYQNVDGFHEGNYIELHFYKELLPGYFWIFPLPNNRANIGLGMLSSKISKRRINLKEMLKHIINQHPNVKERFRNAEPLEKMKGYGLPIGSKRRPCSGHRFLLLGDAASLTDPFTGEGIGNAIRSGRLAAEHVKKAFLVNRFDAAHNKNFDREIYAKMGQELRISTVLQKLLQFPGLFNLVINKASKNESVQRIITSMFDNVDIKKELLKPAFYVKLLFR